MRRAMIAAAVFVTVIGAVLALFWALQRRLMYFPTAHVPTPAEIGLTPVEPVTFETADGLKLSGWFLAASGPLPRLTVLIFNGNAGNQGCRGPLAAALHRHGLQVLLFDYRGYGGSPGPQRRTVSLQMVVPPGRTCWVAPMSTGHALCTSASRWGRPWLSAWPSSTRLLPSSCDRRSPRWQTWDSIIIRSCRCGCCCGTGSRRSIGFTGSDRRCLSSRASTIEWCLSSRVDACTRRLQPERGSSSFRKPITTPTNCSRGTT